MDSKEPRSTICTIKLFVQGTLGQVYEGSTLLSRKDDYNKELGRKLSLKRALENIAARQNISRENRKKLNIVFWKAYFNRIPKIQETQEVKT
jgi:hypothetical protein